MDGCRSAPSGAAHRLDDLGSERRAGVEVEIDPLLVHSCVVSVPAPRLRTYARAAASARTHTSSASSWPSCPPFSKSSGRVAMAFVTCARVAERALDEHEEWWPGIGRDEAGRGDADQGLAARGEQLLRDQHRERRAHGAPDHSDLCVACLPPVETYVRRSGLEPPLLELVRLLASRLNGCAPCVELHYLVQRRTALAARLRQPLRPQRCQRPAPGNDLIQHGVHRFLLLRPRPKHREVLEVAEEREGDLSANVGDLQLPHDEAQTLDSARPARAAANSSSMGNADGAIIPTIITVHMANVKKTSVALHGISIVMPMSAIILSCSIWADI